MLSIWENLPTLTPCIYRQISFFKCMCIVEWSVTSSSCFCPFIHAEFCPDNICQVHSYLRGWADLGCNFIALSNCENLYLHLVGWHFLTGIETNRLIYNIQIHVNSGMVCCRQLLFDLAYILITCLLL